MGATVRDARGGQRVAAGDCLRVPRGASNIVIARVGYRPHVLEVSANGSGDTASIDVVMIPRVGAGTSAGGVERQATTLATQHVTATMRTQPVAGSVQAGIAVSDARERGVSTLNGAIALLPYVALRSARGETGLSLRGARREQVVITLDGLPLNDPATGVADVNDVPLAAVQSVTVRPGADPLGAGSGAVVACWHCPRRRTVWCQYAAVRLVSGPPKRRGPEVRSECDGADPFRIGVRRTILRFSTMPVSARFANGAPTTMSSAAWSRSDS